MNLYLILEDLHCLNHAKVILYLFHSDKKNFLQELGCEQNFNIIGIMLPDWWKNRHCASLGCGLLI